MESLNLTANGIAFHALADGPSDGPLVLCLHGFPELGRSWRHQLPALAAAGYRVVAPDLRGYGGTELQGPYDLRTLVGDVEALIASLGRRRAIVVGHDWGGAVAWSVAALRPSVVEKLVVLNCPPPHELARAMLRSPSQLLRSWYILFFQLPRLPERRMAENCAEVVARALVGGSHRRGVWSADELAAYRVAFARPGRAKAAIDWYRASFRRSLRPGRRRGLPPVQAPTLVLWGTEDRFLGRELADPGRLRRSLADGNEPTVVWIDDAGHFVQNEAPDRVNDELLLWLGPAA
ncbi:MAG TPA: alpha/beta hydrolase [Gaiella sp.]|jgi:pimeloyl-ACP methyl ester carboxylesterase|nr:alpha/beta hydrolase [Gaiella sp.]